jgi:hypothetical protein
MCASWVSGYDPADISARINKIRTIDSQGKTSFRGFEFNEYEILLDSMVRFNKEIPDIEKSRIIRDALFNVGKDVDITDETLLKCITFYEKDYLSRKQKKYILITSISAAYCAKLNDITENGCKIKFISRLNNKFLLNRENLLKVAKDSFCGDLPVDYTCVKIYVSGRSVNEAAIKALDSIDFVRGVWNWYYNRKTIFRISSGLRNPINNIVLGPFHTLHETNGDLATKMWWYQPEYRGALRSYNTEKDINNLRKFRNNVNRRLRKCHYWQELKPLILRYSRAIDGTDLEDSFIKLWSVLEHLTDTGYEGYKVTVRRASFIYSDYELSRQVLTHLKDYRNRAVHASSTTHNIEGYVFQLKKFVENLLRFHLGNKYGFKNIHEAAVLFDLPKNKIEYNSKVKIMKYAKKYI